MSRPRNEKHSADIDAEIRRLEEEKQRLVVAEDQRRGAFIREALSGKSGDQLRDFLRPLITAREAFLFGLEPPKQTRVTAVPRGSQDPSTAADRASRPAIAG